MSTYQPPAGIHTQTITSPGVTIDYPLVFSLRDPQVQARINQSIQSALQELVQQQRKAQSGTHMEMTGHYEVKTNERGILSLSLSNYAYSYPMAHGFTLVKSLTFDLATGTIYSLHDLFKPGSDYVAVLSGLVSAQIKQRGIPLLNGFQTIRPDQDFYLADKALVVYFQLYEITPYYVGFPMFPLSVYDLLRIAADPGPLTVLAADIS